MRRISKVFCAVFALIIFMVSVCGSSYAQTPSVPKYVDSTAEFEITNPISRVQVGDIAYVRINASKLPDNLFGFEFWLSFDESMLTYSAVKHNCSNAASAEKCNNGMIKIAVVSNDGNRISSSDFSATLEFIAKKSGKTDVELDSAISVDNDMNYTEHPDISKTAAINISSNQPSCGGGGGGGGGFIPSGSISVVGGTNTLGSVSATLEPAVQTASPQLGFSDLDDAEFAAAAINELYPMGIINGYGDGRFCPNDSVTRAEFVKMVCLAFNFVVPTDVSETNYSDVSTDSWYSAYIYTANTAGIINGYDDGSFRPDGDISREEAAAVFCRAIENSNFIGESTRLNINFSDEDKISDYAVGFVDKLYMLSVINGDDSGMFRPQDSISRAETAQMIWNAVSQKSVNDSEQINDLAYKSKNYMYSAEDIAQSPEPSLPPDGTSSDAPAETEKPIESKQPEASAEPSVEPDKPLESFEPDFKADKVFECLDLDELYTSNNIFAYLIPNDGSRDAFYDDFTTFQRIGDGDADIVFCIPYLREAEAVGYFYTGEELADFTFETSVNGIDWNTAAASADYHSEEGKWTRAVYNIKTDAAKYLKIKYPQTINWWTPIISKVSAKTGEPVAEGIRTDSDTRFIVPRYDTVEYKLDGYVYDNIGETLKGEVKFSPKTELPEGVAVSDNGVVTITSEAEAGCILTLVLSCDEYNLSEEIEIMLEAAVLGDVNGNGAVDKTDFDTALEAYCVSSTDSDWIKCRDCDINSDGVINVIDIAYISMASVLSKSASVN